MPVPARDAVPTVWVRFWTGDRSRVREQRPRYRISSVSSLKASTLDITVLGLVDIYMPDDTTIDLSVRRVPEPGPGGQHLLQ